MELRFGLEITSNVYRIKLRGDSTNVRLYVDSIEQDVSIKKQCNDSQINKYCPIVTIGQINLLVRTFSLTKNLLNFSVTLYRSQRVKILPKETKIMESCSLPQDIIDLPQMQQLRNF